jgi:hypothetical protein
MAYSGAWVVKSQTRARVALQAPTDPEHLNPTEDLDHPGQQALWVNQAPAPDLPGELFIGQDGQPVVVAGPVDATPDDPNHGVGVGPGLTIRESQELRGTLHSEDFGAVAAHAWDPMVNRDGAPHVEIIDDTPGEGDSPQTLQYGRTGVGQPNDPYARTGRRIKRWYDRYIDMHRYEVELRPQYLRSAKTVALAQPVPTQNQLTSPYPAFTGAPGTPDSFVAPQDRRTPGPWDQALVTDGTDQLAGFGLTSWGL